ncbi:hypothetical protein KA005_70240 [bacterium]|nr:hypothetical protein [bacterium]
MICWKKSETSEADLNQLAEAAVRLKLVSGLYSTKRIRKQAWYMAVGEAQAIFEPQHKKINSMLHISYNGLDYRRWETWKRGILYFVGQISYLIRSLGTPITTGAWFLVCFLITLSISVLVPRRQCVMGLLIGILLAEAVVLLLYKPNKMFSSFLGFDELEYWLCGISMVCFSAVVGNLGGQIAAGFKKPHPVVFTAILSIGIVLTIWGYFVPPNMNRWFWSRGFPFGILASNFMRCLSIAIGAILGITGAIGLCSVWRRSKVLPNEI